MSCLQLLYIFGWGGDDDDLDYVHSSHLNTVMIRKVVTILVAVTVLAMTSAMMARMKTCTSVICGGSRPKSRFFIRGHTSTCDEHT